MYSNGREIERLTEYDQIGNLLSDIGLPAHSRANKSYEGYHYTGLYPNNCLNTQHLGNTGF